VKPRAREIAKVPKKISLEEWGKNKANGNRGATVRGAKEAPKRRVWEVLEQKIKKKNTMLINAWADRA